MSWRGFCRKKSSLLSSWACLGFVMPTAMCSFLLMSHYLETLAFFCREMASRLTSTAAKWGIDAESRRGARREKARTDEGKHVTFSKPFSVGSKPVNDRQDDDPEESMTVSSSLLDVLSVFEDGFGSALCLECGVDVFITTVGLFLFSSIISALRTWNVDFKITFYNRARIRRYEFRQKAE